MENLRYDIQLKIRLKIRHFHSRYNKRLEFTHHSFNNKLKTKKISIQFSLFDKTSPGEFHFRLYLLATE